MRSDLFIIGPLGLVIVLSIAIILLGAMAWAMKDRSRRARPSIICPQAKWHRDGERIMRLRGVRGVEGVYDGRCDCGCRFRWFSPDYSQIQQSGDGAPERN